MQLQLAAAIRNDSCLIRNDIAEPSENLDAKMLNP